MTSTRRTESPEKERDGRRGESFADQAKQDSSGFLREYWDFLAHNKKWWLLPIIVALLLVGVLILLGGTTAAPFIYTLF